MADTGTPLLFEQIDHAALLGNERVDARRLGVEKVGDCSLDSQRWGKELDGSDHSKR